MVRECDVLVVGGGVIGTCCAFSLAERGIDVALLERGEVASGCSLGNAGWIFPSHSLPLAVPGAWRRALRGVGDPDGAFRLRPRPSLDLARWLLRFAHACREADALRAFALRRALGLASLERYADLAARPGLSFGFRQEGLLLACRTPEALRELERECAILEAQGGRFQLLDVATVRERVPALAEDVAGGVFLPDDAHLVPDEFVRRLARELERAGGTVHPHTEVLEIEWRRRRGLRVLTSRGAWRCRELVLAAGAWSPRLARPLGLRLPVEAARGYSTTVRRPPGVGELPVLLCEARVAMTPLGDRLRFAGTLELAGLAGRSDERRVLALERAARACLPGLPPPERLESWSGLRPLTPDDLPILGRPGDSEGLVLATGHGMKGMAHGPATGELVAQLLTGEPTGLDLAPFSPDRFS